MNLIIATVRNYANFSGRASRLEFWLFAAFFVIVSTLANKLDWLSGRHYPIAGRFGRIELIATLLLLLPMLSTGTRRLHDTGRSGWWLMLLYLPYLGWTLARGESSMEMLSLGGIIVGFIALVILLALPADRAANSFGPPPSQSTNKTD
jgi:uncharacterized membrane protein YhaH (DUF805 family)